MVEQPIDETTGERSRILGIATVFHRGREKQLNFP
ncbi:hypothetical protein A2U01_0112894, partial [Trifolium medium]|nr:hypothetical protein [Trifolium medium]